MNLKNLDKVGTIGVFLTALASPCCFPLLGFGLSALGFGAFELFGGWTMWVLQGLVLISLVGVFLSWRKHENLLPLVIGVGSTGLIIYAANFYFSDTLVYAGMFGLLLSSGINYYSNRKAKTCDRELELESTITCPICQHRKKETMPTDSCQWFYECENCKTLLKPKPGDCCVYCSYGSVKCPSIQAGGNCC